MFYDEEIQLLFITNILKLGFMAKPQGIGYPQKYAWNSGGRVWGRSLFWKDPAFICLKWIYEMTYTSKKKKMNDFYNFSYLSYITLK